MRTAWRLIIIFFVLINQAALALLLLMGGLMIRFLLDCFRSDMATENNLELPADVIAEIAEKTYARPDFKQHFLEHGSMTFKNIVLDSPSGNTPHTEIDRIMIDQYELSCIEDKDCMGIIFGDKKTVNWTQCTYSGRWPLYNPIYQNYKHVRALEDLLGPRLSRGIKPYVVFSEKTHKLNVNEMNVLHGEAELKDRRNTHKEPVYSLDELNEIAQKLKIAEIVSPHLLEIHKQEVGQFLAAKIA